VDNTRVVVIAIVIGAAGYLIGSGKLAPLTPSQPSGPDMVTVFSANPNKAEAREHALQFAEICNAAASTFDTDAKRGPNRRIATGLDVSHYRADLLFYTTSGWAFSSKYPLIRTTVGTWLDQEAGTNPKDMTDEETRRWVEAFRGLAKSAEYAGKVIK